MLGYSFPCAAQEIRSGSMPRPAGSSGVSRSPLGQPQNQVVRRSVERAANTKLNPWCICVAASSSSTLCLYFCSIHRSMCDNPQMQLFKSWSRAITWCSCSNPIGESKLCWLWCLYMLCMACNIRTLKLCNLPFFSGSTKLGSLTELYYWVRKHWRMVRLCPGSCLDWMVGMNLE